MTSVPHNLEAERAVLGAVLLSDRALEPLLVEDGLRPGHFYRPAHQLVFEAMVALSDQTAAVDVLTVTAQLEKTGRLAEVGGKAAIAGLLTEVDAPGNVRHYARIVLEQAGWRHRQTAAAEMLQAVAERDEDRFTVAEQMLADPVRGGDDTSTAEELAHLVFEHVETDQDEEPAISLPFEKLTSKLNGGLHPGDATVVSGWTNQGKSALVDQLLEHASFRGARTHLYMNEGAKRKRAMRMAARLSGVPYSKILRRGLDDREKRSLVAALNKMPFGITPVPQWPVQDIARHIRRSRWDLCAVDLATLIPRPKGAGQVEGFDEISAALNLVAVQADCHVLIVVHLNQERNKDAIKPRPVLRDIRGTGSWANDAANVMFVHRDQEEILGPGGEPTGVVEMLPEGQVYLEKTRDAETCEVKVRLNPQRMRFEAVP